MTIPRRPRLFPNRNATVSLHWKEFVVAAHSGLLRRLEQIWKGKTDRWIEGDGWSSDVNGCIGEVVVAKALGVYWSPGEQGKSDLEQLGIEVRSSRWNDPCLILHDDDHDDVPYVLVWLWQNEGHVAGWLYGRDGKQSRYWDRSKPRPAYFVPMRDLRPFHELRKILSERP